MKETKQKCNFYRLIRYYTEEVSNAEMTNQEFSINVLYPFCIILSEELYIYFIACC